MSVTLDIRTEGNLAVVTRREQALSDGERPDQHADERHVAAFQQGERQAFDQLMQAHRGRVYGICYRYTGSREDADDVSQEVFLRAYKGLSGFRGDAKFSTWLYRIAVNACLNWVSSRKPGGEELPQNLRDAGPTPHEQASQRELSDTVRAAVRRLPERQRMTLVLRVYEGLTHKEIGVVMGCPVGTAKANFFFALKNLRKQLEGEDVFRDENMG